MNNSIAEAEGPVVAEKTLSFTDAAAGQTTNTPQLLRSVRADTVSAAKFLPSVAEIVNRLKVVSARSTYERMYPDSPLDWKFAAFSRELEAFYKDFEADKHRNIISFGDSLHEREAIHLVTGSMANVHTKSVKFVERPSIRQLQHQVDMVIGYFAHIYHYEDSLDLMLSVNSDEEASAK